MSRTRGWCFTINNFSETDLENFKQLEVLYICVGKEIGESGTPHLQGYLYLANPKGLGGMKKIHEKAHWEPQKGTHEQAAQYCKKDGDYWEKGELPKQGARSDLEAAAVMVRKGASLRAVAEEHPGTFVRYAKGLAALRETQMKDRTEKPEVVWLWGSTGVGKTKEAMDNQNGCLSIYMKDGTQWWNGYEQQDRIVIDDFDGKWPYRDLLRLLDRYPYQGQTKGAYVKINSKEIYITAEHPPSGYWPAGSSQLAQIMRRLTRCTEVSAQK